MSWFTETFQSAIGKKLLMALTGFGFVFFLLIHLIGNLTLYFGQAVFLSYVRHLHALGPLITVAEIGLLVFAAVHVTTGTILFLQNLKARPKRYAVNKNGGGRTLSSATMPYSGFIILLFIVLHLINFRFIANPEQMLYQVVSHTFSLWGYVCIYTLAVIIVAFHVRHGFWSLFQSMGLNHEKYMPAIRKAAVAFAVIAALGFGFIPVYIGFIAS